MFKKFWQWLKKLLRRLFTGSKSKTASQPLNAIIRTIGYRWSGKTTYLAALAHWPNANPNSPVEQIEPIGNNGRELLSGAQDILEQGDCFETTPLKNIEEVKDYQLQITLKSGFAWEEEPLVTLMVYSKDYSGEFFQDLIENPNNSIVEDYLDDCKEAEGLMLLVDGTSWRLDQQFALGIKEFFRRLDQLGEKKRRLALVLNKCEQPELWVNRHEPRKIAEARFPRLVKALQNWEEKRAVEVDYFAASAFGMLGTHVQEPNMKKVKGGREGLEECVLQNTQRWRPFGLVAPLYWLSSGRRHPDLELD